MDVEIVGRPKPLFRDKGDVVYGAFMTYIVTALSAEAQRLRIAHQTDSDQPQVGVHSVPFFVHGAVSVEIVMDLGIGAMRTRTWIGSGDRRWEKQHQGDFYYWNKNFVGVPNTREQQAKFADEAAKQLNVHQSAVRGCRARGLPLRAQ